MAISRPVVLIGFGEALAAIESAWSLRAAGFEVVAFTRSGSRPALRHCHGVQIHAISPPEKDAAGAVRDVEALVRSVRPDSLLPLDDFALWICKEVKVDGVVTAGGTGDAIEVALDKSRQLALARAAGLLVPETQEVTALKDLTPTAWPVVIKPARAIYESGGALIRSIGAACADQDELARAAARGWYPPLLAQPLIQGVGEGLFGHASADGVVAWSAHRRLRMLNPEGSASSACVSIPADPHLMDAVERLVYSIGWRGMFMAEFLRDAEGKPWFMELNGRAWGSMALARRRGFEYPAWTVQAAIDPSFKPVPPPSPPNVRCRHLGMEITHLAFVLRGPKSKAFTGWPRPWPTLGALLKVSRRDRLYNWNRREPRVLLADTWQTLGFYRRRMTRRIS